MPITCSFKPDGPQHDPCAVVVHTSSGTLHGNKRLYGGPAATDAQGLPPRLLSLRQPCSLTASCWQQPHPGSLQRWLLQALLAISPQNIHRVAACTVLTLLTRTPHCSGAGHAARSHRGWHSTSHAALITCSWLINTRRAAIKRCPRPKGSQRCSVA